MAEHSARPLISLRPAFTAGRNARTSSIRRKQFPSMAAFTKSQRLLAKPQFDAVLNNGIKVVCRDFVVVASSKDSDSGSSRLGLIVSGKVGNSVQRNRIKRCVREVFRDGVPTAVQSRDVVVIARAAITTKDGKVSRDVHSSFARCLERLGKVVGNKA